MTKNEVSTLKKGLLLLELVKQRKGITLREVMDEQNLSKSTAFRLLTTLEEMGYIYKIQTQYFINHNMFSVSVEKRSETDWTSFHSVYQVAQNVTDEYLYRKSGRDGSCDDSSLTCTLSRVST